MSRIERDPVHRIGTFQDPQRFIGPRPLGILLCMHRPVARVALQPDLGRDVIGPGPHRHRFHRRSWRAPPPSALGRSAAKPNSQADRYWCRHQDCCGRVLRSRDERSCKTCRVSKVRLDALKHLGDLKGEQPCNSVEYWRMCCTETHDPIRQSCGPNKPAKQEHECHANHGADYDVAWPMFSPIQQWQADRQRYPNGCRCAQPA